MGGIPSMLLMIAAAGVTYGWQPDANGDRATDVEYIVQISPAEWERMRSSSSGGASGITSVIDPEVRGKVSRIVLRVGTGDVPRKTLDSVNAPRVATLKPDPQGFGLPSSLQESAGNAAGDFANQAVDRAGRAIDRTLDRVADQATNQANQGVSNLSDWMRGNQQGAAAADRARVAPPSTRPATRPTTSNVFQPGSGIQPGSGLQSGAAGNSLGQSATNRSAQPDSRLSTPFAGPRTGGPSTAPSNSNDPASVTGRDNRWADFAARQAANDLRTAQPQGNSPPQNGSTNASLASNGLLPSDSFGKMPRGLESFGSNPNTLADRGDRDALNSAASNQGFAQNDLNNQNLRFDDRSTGVDRNLRNTGGNSFGRNPREPLASRRNPNLTSAQIAAGGWDFDDYDRLIDQNGQLVRGGQPGPAESFSNGSRFPSPQYADNQAVDPFGRSRNSATNDSGMSGSYPGQGYSNERSSGMAGDDRYRNTAGSDPRFANANDRDFDPRNARSAYEDPRSRNQFAEDQRSPRYASTDTDPRSSSDYRSVPQRAEMDSAANRVTSRSMNDDYSGGRSYRASTAEDPAASRVVQSGMETGSMSTIPYIKPKQVAAQPLFNGLLLISIVANLYLIFWLKNLRVQFKDMVAAKRLSQSTASVA